jgi:hypothetical protein
MKTNSRWSFVCEGLKQAGLVFGALLGLVLLLGGIGKILEYVGIIHYDAIFILLGLPALCGASVLIGPVPTLLTFFDISDKQLLVLSCIFIILYWAGLGIIAGLFQQPNHNPDANQDQNFPAKQIAKRIRWTIEIVAVLVAILFFLDGPIAGPNYISNGRYSAGEYRNAIINEVRQVDAARNEFVLEKNPSTNHIVTEADIMPYIKLNSEGKIPRIGTVRYVLNPLDKPVYAVFDSDFRIPRHGWHEGFTFTHGTVFQLP